jgi:hypothetical protein
LDFSLVTAQDFGDKRRKMLIPVVPRGIAGTATQIRAVLDEKFFVFKGKHSSDFHRARSLVADCLVLVRRQRIVVMKTKRLLMVSGLVGVLSLISAAYCFWLMTVPLSSDLVYVVVIGFIVSAGMFVIGLETP